MLGTAGYECDEAWGHKAVLRALKRIEKYDLLFCQVSALEKEDKLLTWVLSRGKDIPVVACAARPREQVPKRIYDRCIFLQILFEREQLLSVVREALNNHD